MKPTFLFTLVAHMRRTWLGWFVCLKVKKGSRKLENTRRGASRAFFVVGNVSLAIQNSAGNLNQILCVLRELRGLYFEEIFYGKRP